MLSSLLLALLLGTPNAHASSTDDERARELYENGAILYEEGRYEDAVAAWQEAYRISQRPQLLFNIANAEERLGRYSEALDHLNRYRAFAAADERDTLDRRIANLERRLAEQPVTPTPTPVSPEPKRHVPVVPVVLFSLGGASAITGGVFAGLANNARGEAADLCIESDSNVWCPSAAETPIKHDSTDSLLADVSFGVAAVSLIGGVVTLVVPYDTRLTASLLPGGGFLTLRGNF